MYEQISKIKDPVLRFICKILYGLSFIWLLNEMLDRVYIFRAFNEKHNISKKYARKIMIYWIWRFPLEVIYWDFYWLTKEAISRIRRKFYKTKKEKGLIEVFGEDVFEPHDYSPE